MNHRSLRWVTGIALLGLLGCGSTVGSATGDSFDALDDCSTERLNSNGSGIVEGPPPLSTLVDPSLHWVRTQDAVQPGRTRDVGLVEFDSEISQAEIVRRSDVVPSTPFSATPAIVNRLAGLRPGAATVFLGLDSRGVAVVAAAAAPDGRVIFVGDCEEKTLGSAWAVFLSQQASDESPVAVLESVIQDPSSERALSISGSLTPPSAWEALPEGTRLILPGETPDSILAQLSQIQLEIESPSDWKGDESVSVCGRLPGTGWSSCTRFLDSDGQGTTLHPVYVNVGDPVEVWLVDGMGNVQDPLGLLVGLSSEAVDAAVKSGAGIRMMPDTSIRTIPDLVSAVRADGPTFLVATPEVSG